MESHCSSTEEIDVDSNTEEIDLKDTFSEKIDIKDDESVSSESSDTCELELKSSSRECPRDGTSQAGESDVETQCTGIIRFSSPLPMHRWVQRVDVSDSDTYSLPCPARPSSPWGRFDPYDSQEDQKQEYVGFATLPNQMHRKSLKRGFEFTLMVVGESGLGKSTLVNCLFLTDLYKDRTICDVEDRINQTVAITKKTVNIVEKGVKLKLNIVDTPGFADAIDTTNSWKPVVDYIDWQFEEYLRGEISVNRKNIPDNRVHCCLYFISPYGHGLKPIDVEFMKALHEKVNIVPVLAKADCLTHSEIQHMKNRILNEIDDHRIKIFQFPECDSDEDELFRKQDFELKKRIPFAVIGSNTTVESNGRRFRARLYPWGTVEVENPAYCDFVHLRAMLVRTHMQDLKDMTQDTLYERYRNQSLYRKTKRFSLWCSLSIEDHEDAELAYTMRDLPPRAGHVFRGQEESLVDRELDSSARSVTPGTPTFAVRRNLLSSEPELVHRTRSLEYPVSPSQLRSPRSSFDPYHSSEDQDKEYVGFATLPNQLHRKSVKRGFAFSLMVAGESGLGKSTLVNSLFLTDLYKDRKVLNAEERIMKTVEILKHTVGIEEKGVKLQLNIVDTPGFGDAVNNTESWKPVVDYIDQQFEQYFRDESGLNRRNIQDNRVHCCLYFISPYGHGPIDVEFMKTLQEKVNIVPVLAKADSLTLPEVAWRKIKIREEIERFGIKIYQFPECDSDEDEEFKFQDQQLKDSVPFAVVGSNVVVESKGKILRGRLYPWGVVEVENPAHSDFLKLRNMLVRTHLQDLKDVTRETHYENYRAQRIHSMTSMVVRERKRSLCNQLRESVSDLPLVPVDSETERLIWEKDAELRQMQDMLQRFQEHLQHSH